ncbi:MAG: DUF2939 domain-containing protein [Pseudomonadota bacterium]|nr:DUF2939 domain-containing protein [Pseudomonadota bacterium]
MKKWIALLVLAVILMIGYVAAGPFLTVNAIRNAVQSNNTAALSRHVDFVAVRRSLKAQVDDYIVREAGADMQANPFGAIAVRIAAGVAGGAVDAMATPAGIAAILQGRGLLHRITGGGIRDDDAYASAPPRNPLESAEYGFESTSRFTATVLNDDGEPVVFVLTRAGLDWNLTDIRLPLGNTAIAR